MKKFENWLFLPVLILLFFSASKYGAASVDIEVADTYYIVSSAKIAGIFALWLLFVFFLLKRLRRRQQVLPKKIAIAYITLTVLFLGLFLGLGFVGGGSAAGNFTDSDLDGLIFRNKLRMTCAWGCLIVQVIFLIYFIIQMVKRPATSAL
jgi:hypothetical protein